MTEFLLRQTSSISYYSAVEDFDSSHDDVTPNTPRPDDVTPNTPRPEAKFQRLQNVTQSRSLAASFALGSFGLLDCLASDNRKFGYFMIATSVIMYASSCFDSSMPKEDLRASSPLSSDSSEWEQSGSEPTESTQLFEKINRGSTIESFDTAFKERRIDFDQEGICHHRECGMLFP